MKEKEDRRASKVVPVDTYRWLTIYKVTSLDGTEEWYDVDTAMLTGDCFTSVIEARRAIDQLAAEDIPEGPGVAYEGLPPFCFTCTATQPGSILMIKRLQSGYVKMQGEYPTGLRTIVNRMNTSIDVTRPQEEAMKAGSMHGWDKFASDPAMYDDNGHGKVDYTMSKRVDYGEGGTQDAGSDT